MLLLNHCLLLLPFYYFWSLLCNVVLCVLSSFAIIFLRKRELFALLCDLAVV